MKLHPMAVLAALAGALVPGALEAAKPAEIELHIEATAQVPPDRVIVPVVINGRGADQAAAQADLAKQEAALLEQTRNLGIDRSKVKIPSHPEVLATEAQDVAACAAAASSEAAAAPRKGGGRSRPATYSCDVDQVFSVSKTLMVELDDPALIEKVQTSGGGEPSGYGRSRPQFSQSDPAAADRKARDWALAKARADADAYAEAMGYRVVRIVRVSNAKPALSLQEVIGFFALMDDRANRMQPSWFATAAVQSVGIDFIIQPK